ncbi:MAG: M36 family metallopeptidase, partial [Myxococcota bacterium]
MVSAQPALGQPFPDRFDRREVGVVSAPSIDKIGQAQAITELTKTVPGAIVNGGQDFLTPISIMSMRGALTAASSRSTERVGLDFLHRHVGVFGLTSADLSLELTDRVVTRQTGVVHEFYRQIHPKTELPVFYTQAQFHTQKGRLLLTNVGLTEVSRAIVDTTPAISAGEAVIAAAEFFGIPAANAEVIEEKVTGFRRVATVTADYLDRPVKAEFGLLPIDANTLEPVWFVRDAWLSDGPLYDMTVSAAARSAVNGRAARLLTAFNNHKDGTYRAYSAPIESPIHTAPQPPSDARVLVTNPENATASPAGWFDGGSTIMSGNNVRACADRDGNNSCDPGQPSCPGQVCDFPVDLTAEPSAYTDAAIANLFYWNNHIHDIQYQYGFDEQGGNFQENNFGNGGAGSDAVNADAQDNANGSSRCNANFGTPSDGGNPRMQMFICDETSPQRDGSFDNGVIVHEYGHGISTRQVGGPSTSCLNNRQQAGEGWSDWLALAYTAKPADRGPDVRGVGSYLFGLGPNGTIRPQNYSTDEAVNSYTYASINGLSIPHGVGSVWSQVAWEVYWRLVDKHGFDADLSTFSATNPNTAGNKRAMFYINEGLKN